eukprot:4329870-Prorocentrum_lima.AAC.1
MVDLQRKGVYPIQNNNWWLAHQAGKPVTPDMTTSSNAEGRYWYCPCCGKKYNAGQHLKDRLLIIVPPGSSHSVKEQNVTAENNS